MVQRGDEKFAAAAREFAQAHSRLSWIGEEKLMRLGLALALLQTGQGRLAEMGTLLAGFLVELGERDPLRVVGDAGLGEAIAAVRLGLGDGPEGAPVTVVLCGTVNRLAAEVGELVKRAVEERLAQVFLVEAGVEMLDELVLFAEYESEALPRIVVDAGDALAVFRVAQESVAHARRGQGPALIVGVRVPEMA